MSAVNETPLEVGQIVAGRYRIERILGQGGMGVVVAARHIDLDETFALKVMLPAAFANQEAVERFVREARMAAKLKSVHAAKVFDSGRLPSGAPFLAMEYLQGRDLDHELHARGPLPIEEVAAYGMQVCDVLSEAHASGIVHRDLKPANLFLAQLPNGGQCVKVLDFGIAKQTDPRAASMTQTTHVFGTPLYMSPEQMKSSKAVDARSDIWSLGVTLYELCTGALPYDADSLTSMIAKILTEPPILPSQRRPGIPYGFEQLLLRCIALKPEARFQSAAHLSQALAGFSVRATLPSIPLVPMAASAVTGPRITGGGQTQQLAYRPTAVPTHAGVSTNHTAPPLGARPLALAAILGGAAVVAAAGVLLTVRALSSPGPDPAATHEAEPATPSSPGLSPSAPVPVELPSASVVVPTVSPQQSAEPTAPATVSPVPSPSVAVPAATPKATVAPSVAPATAKPTAKPTVKPTPSSTKTRGGFF